MKMTTQQRKRVQTGIFVAAIGLCVIVGGCIGLAKQPTREELDRSLAEFSIVILPDATDVRYVERCGIDVSYVVRFTLPRNKVSGVLAEIGFPATSFQAGRLFENSEEDMSWWRPDELMNVESAKWDEPGRVGREAMVGEVGGVIVVYILCGTV